MMSSDAFIWLDHVDFSDVVETTKTEKCEGVQVILDAINEATSLMAFAKALSLIGQESKLGHLTKLEEDLLRFILTNETANNAGWRLNDAVETKVLLLEGDEVEHYAKFLRESWNSSIEFPLTEKVTELGCVRKEALLDESENNKSPRNKEQ